MLEVARRDVVELLEQCLLLLLLLAVVENAVSRLRLVRAPAFSERNRRDEAVVREVAPAMRPSRGTVRSNLKECQ